MLTGDLPSGMNHKFITLIPKRKIPKTMKDLRPIYLCNIVLKILTKVLANRFKSTLPFLISEIQNTFVAWRSIVDNILIAFELNHYLKSKQHGGRGEVALKLDIVIHFQNSHVF